MTTATIGTETLEPREGSHLGLEDLVDRVLECLVLPGTGMRHVARAVHDARRMRKAGDLDGALKNLAALDTSEAARGEVRWAYSEWLDIARRRFQGCNALLYSQGPGRASVLLRRGDGTLEVAATLGMRWRLGKVLSRRSLRGMRPLEGTPSC